jgi:hypothetical protein
MRVRPRVGADARQRPRVGTDAHRRPQVGADALESGEGIRNLGRRGRVGGRRSERVNGENNLKNISFTQFQIC